VAAPMGWAVVLMAIALAAYGGPADWTTATVDDGTPCGNYSSMVLDGSHGIYISYHQGGGTGAYGELRCTCNKGQHLPPVADANGPYSGYIGDMVVLVVTVPSQVDGDAALRHILPAIPPPRAARGYPGNGGVTSTFPPSPLLSAMT